MTPAMYRKKPVTIQALRYDGTDESAKDIGDWMAAHGVPGLTASLDEPRHLVIQTLEGDMKASVGDYVIRGVQGEFYPCKPEIFAATYDAA